jgi:Cys-tRNA(Pro) deacylase
VIGVKTISPCTPDTAHRHTGYMVGGTSPFGTRKPLPVYMERTILELSRIYINGGKRGYLVGLDPNDAVRLLKPELVTVATDKF